ncbi:glycine/betaine ABC transporter substrate-binding protein [Fulvimarina endophytica]|uniref:Glycine/betaine ABC transporter substrate-binding protein n=1 Tax=Fulvimarina endophytica TaxID=2293836 RepID=A0A371X9Y7_9HYPH|nr:ABC transporter substrate-binding protein [Fulvimarina endophytica]RFC66045.1 glycine/betaine ABC transporter substrate-binding protein [Fulvimarina endophytica]
MFKPTVAGAFALSLLAFSSLSATADPLSGTSGNASGSATVTVGSADFPESQLLATIYAKALQAKGMDVATRLNIGSREVYIPALLDGSIDLLPEYSGALLSYLNKESTAHAPDEVLEALKEALPDGVTILEASDAQNSDMLAVTRETAEKYGLETIGDIAPVGGEIVVGAAPEWRTRHEGLVGLNEVYGIDFKSMKPLDVGGPLTLSALVNGQVQAANLFSTDPAIAANDLVVLKDDKNLFSAQNIVPLIAEAKLTDDISSTLDAVSEALTTEDLVEMNGRLAQHEGYDAVAEDWLTENGLN